MWAFLLLTILVAFLLLKQRETFVLKYGNPFDGEDMISFDSEAKGTRLFGITPDTCPTDKPVLDAGLCYQECEEGYNGVGPVCWAKSQSVGIGTIPTIEWYKQKTSSWGSIGCSRGRSFRFSGYDDCYEYDIWKARQLCDKDREMKDGLCYRKCPKELPDRIPGMPYLCYRNLRGLSYGRGVGTVPPVFKFGA
jgi:hypothetical protein